MNPILVPCLLASFVTLGQDPRPASSVRGAVPSSKLVSLERIDGESVVAEVLRLDGDRVRLRMPVLGGHIEASRPLADFTPAARHRIELAVNPPAGFDGHFAAARRAAELGQLGDAALQARAAAKALANDPDAAAKQAELRTWGADAVEGMIRTAIEGGDLGRARRALSILSSRLSDQRTDEQLDAIADAVEAAEAEREQQRRAARQEREAAAARSETHERLDAIAEHVAKGTKAYREAIRKRSTTAATKLCEEAIGHFRVANTRLREFLAARTDGAAGEPGTTPEQIAQADLEDAISERAMALARTLHDGAIAAALHAATMLGVQSDYRGALEWTNRVLAFDPGNPDAKALQRTLTIAAADSADDMRWGWTLGDLGRVGDAPRGRDH